MCFAAHPIKAQSVTPVPLKMERGTGFFQLLDDTPYETNLRGKDARWLARTLRSLPVRLIPAEQADASPRLTLRLTDASAVLSSPESYTLSVTPEHIRVEASSVSGLFYGVQSLGQLVTPAGTGFTVPAVEVEDTPRFAYRGFMLDVSRHFFPKAFVKKQIDALARYKINRLHLHLTDAAGWRIEIKKYPRLTDLAAWRSGANWKSWWNGDRRYLPEGSEGAFGGYYTREDIRELVDYARERCITIVPEIEMPSHSEEVLAAYPELSCSGEPYKNADFCVGNERTFTFLENVLTEVMQLFPSEYIHIGGDEAGMSAWKTCPKCQKRIRDEHLDGVEGLQSYLIHRIEKFLNRHGRHLLGWDEILKGGLAPHATVMSWRGEEGGLAAIRSGHRAVMTPGSHCYFDGYQDAPSTQPEAIGGYLPLQKVYAYNPVPATLTSQQARLVDGVQANLWTEYIPTPEHVEYMMYPRILALAEVAWSAPECKSWPDFHRRALHEVDWLRAAGYHPFDLSKEVGPRPASLQPVDHLARGKKVHYNAPYNLSYRAAGDGSLTDGLQGDWTYSDGRWQGFISKDRLDVTVDLEQPTDIHTVSASFLQVAGPDVFLPGSVTISVSDDGIHFTPLLQRTAAVSKQLAVQYQDITWHGSARGRFVRYQAKADPAVSGWIFTDEIIIR
ncbi:glycosyl hydrolase family 20, catalytic domain protein [gut metagenome]|uniref:beta-N-acetylhexosaminidase n=1 Tax=gut metagenome TaxID=749906 RepID=J9GKR9_9ZZZZ